MMGSAVIVVAELSAGRRALSLEGHQLVVRGSAGETAIVESRPVTEYAAAVDREGCLHIVAWLLSRHLMYYTSVDGANFSRSTLLTGDGQLRIKEPMIWADKAVTVAYLAETETSDTLVCYRYSGSDWEGRRLSEVDLPDRLVPLQFDGGSGSLSVIYSVRSRGQTVICARSVDGGPVETIATTTDGISDFCALTTAGVRHVSWLSNGYLFADNQMIGEEPWKQNFPYLKWDGGALQCLWLAESRLYGTTLGRPRQRLRTAQMRNPMACRLALPGELRRAIVDGATLHELLLAPEDPVGAAPAMQTMGMPPQRAAAGAATPTLTEIVRNQASYLTRLQESVTALERNVLRLTSDVNRLSREVAALLRAERSQPTAAAAAAMVTASPQRSPEQAAVQAAEVSEETGDVSTVSQ